MIRSTASQTPKSWLATALAIALLASTSATRAQDVNLDDMGNRGFIVVGTVDSFSGAAVSGAGDVNGDGRGDVIIGSASLVVGSGFGSRQTYVVFGKADNATLTTNALGNAGFQIVSDVLSDNAGSSVSGAGDVNGDGLADVILGASGTDGGRGVAYVVFGKSSPAPVPLATLGSAGFRILGASAGDKAGLSVSSAGDVNGDGLADVIVGAPLADPSGRGNAGSSYIVFGKSNSSDVNLNALGNGGFRIDGGGANAQTGSMVSGAGDFNADGRPDVVISPLNRDGCYVVFGKTDLAPIDLSALGADGIVVGNPLAGARALCAGAGYVNDDQFADLVLGDYDWFESSVVFGRSSTTQITPGAPGSNTFPISPADSLAVAGSGDITGDGLGDVLIGNDGRDRAHLVFGKNDTLPVNVGVPGAGHFALYNNWFAGYAVSGAGDINGDGLADMITSDGALKTYVVFSTSVPPASANYRTNNRIGNSPRVPVGIIGNGSNDNTPDARTWIDFADGTDLLSRPVTSEVVTLSRNAGAYTAAAANVSWRLQTTRINWTSAEIRFRYADSELTIADENTLQVVYSLTGGAPFVPLVSVVNPANNTISANITAPGYFYLGQVPQDPLIFSNGFE